VHGDHPRRSDLAGPSWRSSGPRLRPEQARDRKPPAVISTASPRTPRREDPRQYTADHIALSIRELMTTRRRVTWDFPDWPGGLSLEEATRYVGASAETFLRYVKVAPQLGGPRGLASCPDPQDQR
jgi:hypothetical protein